MPRWMELIGMDVGVMEVGRGTVVDERLIGCRKGESPGPTLICVAGVHGNEPAGVHAVRRVLLALEGRTAEMTGDIVGFDMPPRRHPVLRATPPSWPGEEPGGRQRHSARPTCRIPPKASPPRGCDPRAPSASLSSLRPPRNPPPTVSTDHTALRRARRSR